MYRDGTNKLLLVFLVLLFCLFVVSKNVTKEHSSLWVPCFTGVQLMSAMTWITLFWSYLPLLQDPDQLAILISCHCSSRQELASGSVMTSLLSLWWSSSLAFSYTAGWKRSQKIGQANLTGTQHYQPRWHTSL